MCHVWAGAVFFQQVTAVTASGCPGVRKGAEPNVAAARSNLYAL